jgi:hypothetical protein
VGVAKRSPADHDYLNLTALEYLLGLLWLGNLTYRRHRLIDSLGNELR